MEQSAASHRVWHCTRAHLSRSADKMQQLFAYVLISALALAAFSDASWKPPFQLQNEPVGPLASKGLEPPQSHHLGLISPHRRQLGLQDPPHIVADLSKKQGPWLEEEEEAYGWMDFGRRSAEEGAERP
ncbi:gastrin [Tamandua tetradactyla]|uniref:gastrin n=1 Tax=Tamandua tetradactyla TaxID=48850 RepID=UPI00405400DA